MESGPRSISLKPGIAPSGLSQLPVLGKLDAPGLCGVSLSCCNPLDSIFVTQTSFQADTRTNRVRIQLGWDSAEPQVTSPVPAAHAAGGCVWISFFGFRANGRLTHLLLPCQWIPGASPALEPPRHYTPERQLHALPRCARNRAKSANCDTALFKLLDYPTSRLPHRRYTPPFIGTRAAAGLGRGVDLAREDGRAVPQQSKMDFACRLSGKWPRLT